jgi:hypothetical protein
MRTQNERAPTAGTVRGAEKSAGERTFRDEDSTAHHHATHASADPLLHRLDGVQRAGTGWRARCPACEGRSRKLSVAESDGRVLIHCFGGCAAADVLAAVGLGWKDIMPPRSWPLSREEQRRARRAIQQTGWAAALAVLALESKIVAIAANDIHHLGGLQSSRDLDRLSLAVERIGAASATLIDAEASR